MSKKQVYVHPCLKVRDVQVRTALATSFFSGVNNDGTEEYQVGSTEGWQY